MPHEQPPCPFCGGDPAHPDGAPSCQEVYEDTLADEARAIHQKGEDMDCIRCGLTRELVGNPERGDYGCRCTREEVESAQMDALNAEAWKLVAAMAAHQAMDIGTILGRDHRQQAVDLLARYHRLVRQGER